MVSYHGLHVNGKSDYKTTHASKAWEVPDRRQRVKSNLTSTKARSGVTGWFFIDGQNNTYPTVRLTTKSVLEEFGSTHPAEYVQEHLGLI